MEKICLSLRGPRLKKSKGFRGWGPPGPLFGMPAGFSHPRNPKISKVASALIASGETNFLQHFYLKPESPQPEAALGRATPIGKMGGAGPTSEADSNRSLIRSAERPRKAGDSGFLREEIF